MALQWFTYENPLRAISTNIHSPLTQQIGPYKLLFIKTACWPLDFSSQNLRFKMWKMVVKLFTYFSTRGTACSSVAFVPHKKAARVTFQVMIPLLSCEGEERRHELKKNKAGPVCGEGWTLRSIGHQQLSVSVQLRVTGRCPRKKKAQWGGRITRCKAQPVDLLFSSKLSISLSASIFSFSQPFL